ncbi:filamentous hemagglutinin N-terminal domain-containing protein [Candidatus Synechococcus calcipolaris G9]|uniref:Filamentous hemagglutinin N-terminal domain-containing protein n=1 Tax=Candidatus Synechococcus calcipolaris G9 TaxID=1497997 RepID=A0ABT6F0V8_9SYNE|nr:filamentous hemagglutinin N-terminal domain-containing protein [Candidatus Synechococcus calcipolaris]MDG2991489.1 filamentous hemagglutinin N-terminal domain-containing protein [Candidatus Synechococcus calcipolaris G9]
MFKVARSWFAFFAVLSVFIPRPTTAQITPAVNGTGTTVTVNGQQFDIGGGAFSQDGQNLFHLFKQFGLNDGQIANFLSNPGVRNILAGVNGGDVSYINGLIQVMGGNSNLYLLNPAGIVFGPNAQLNVPAAFHASTASRVHFDGGIFDLNAMNDYTNLVGNPTGFEFLSTGIIINEGNLAVGPGQNLTLMGHQVFNTGTLSAPGGRITIQAVPETGMVRISQEGMILSLEIPADRIPEDGVIEAVDLPRLITGGEDRPRVNSVVHHDDGSFSLVHDPNKVNLPMDTPTAVVSGTVDVSNPTGIGGQINVLGQNVAVINANLRADGQLGGGTILGGGDYLGGRAGTGRLDSSFNAQNTFVDNNSVLSANAVTQGNGGTIITWADNSTTFNGSLSARGGELGGDGGFAEISGRETLSIGPGWSNRIDLAAPLGQAGTLLFDPNDITIQGGNVTPIGASPTNANTLGAADINFFLQNTGSLIIETTGMGGNGDITFENLALVSWLSGNSLTLNADRDITMSLGSGVVSVLGDITYNADRDIQINSVAGVASVSGDITFNAGRDIELNSVSGVASGTGNILFDAGQDTRLNSVTGVAGGLRDITFNADRNISLTNSSIVTATGNITLNANGNVTQDGSSTLQAVGLELLGGGSFTLNSSTNSIMTLAANTTGDIQFTNAGELEVGTVNGTVGLEFTGNVTLTALGEGDVFVIEDIIKTGPGTSNLILQAEGNIFIDPIDIESLDGPLNVVLNSDRNRNGGGIYLCCTNIFTNGGNVIMGGGLDPLNIPAMGTNGTLGAGIYAGAWIETNGGNISMRGQGQDGVDDAAGVYLDGAFFETGSGNVFIQGQGGNDGTFNDGILLTPSTVIETTTGNVTLQGQAGDNDDFNGGVVLSPFAIIETISGNISIQGQGGNNGDDNPGVVIAPIASIMTETGNIFIRGQGGSGGTDNYGILLGESDPAMPTIANNVSGSLVLEGIGGNGAIGIINPCGCIDSFLGNINSTANITLAADRMDLEFVQVLGRGTLTLQPLTPSATMGIGDGAPGTLQLSTPILDHLLNDPAFNQFSQINFGRSNGTGLVTAQGYTFTNNVTFQSGGAGSQGIQVTGPVSVGNNTLGFNSGGPVTQSAPITANALQLNGSGPVILTNANNNVNTLTANTTNSITYRDVNDLTLAGVNTNGNILNLTTGGNLNQTAPIQTGGLALTVNGNVSLMNPNNQINRVAAETTGSLSLVNNGTLTVDTVNPTGISSGGSVFLQTLNGNIVLNQPVRSQAGGDAVVLAAANNFTNNAGSLAIQAPNGRWLVYSTDPNLDQLGGLEGSAQFESPYPTNPRFSGSGFLYRVSRPVQPSTTVISTTVLEPSAPPPFPADSAIPSLEFSFPGNIATILQGEEEGNLPLEKSLCEVAGDESPLDIDGVPTVNAELEDLCDPKQAQD